ncbi:GPI-anchored surface protein, putative [Bodo saltans]|uniref:GPI-anchored surface protein, putative n=1 Tax=Bodo saltans TaxID=75058 RepID=A0A0S4IMD7_BODSA|nr:GPI-anchored surface protein, putative [Bodo saltans]|eukprot:CUF43032.1 GPI-anchored surface protein, putative [Bodo saltans]
MRSSHRNGSSTSYRVGCLLPSPCACSGEDLGAAQSSSLSALPTDDGSAAQATAIRRRRLLDLMDAVQIYHCKDGASSRSTSDAEQKCTSLLGTLLVTSVASSFRLISTTEAAVHDIDLITLVRRSWFGELTRDSSGAPRSVKFRFPLLNAMGGDHYELADRAAASSTSVTNSGEQNVNSNTQGQGNHREHATVVCVVQRSGFVSLHTSSCVEDIGGIAQYVHQQLRPHVCAVGGGAELEHSIASVVPEDLRLIYFGAAMTLPRELFLLMRHVSQHHHQSRGTSIGTLNSQVVPQLPVRKLREACESIWGRSPAATHENTEKSQQDVPADRSKLEKNKKKPTKKRDRNNDAGDDDAIGDGRHARKSVADQGASALRRTKVTGGSFDLLASTSLSVFDTNAYQELSFGASVAAGSMNGFRNIWDRPNKTATDVDEDDDAMLASLFQQQSAMLSMTDVFQFASMVPNMVVQESSAYHPLSFSAVGVHIGGRDEGTNDEVIAPLLRSGDGTSADDQKAATVSETTGSSSAQKKQQQQHEAAAQQQQHLQDVLVSRKYREICHVEVLPSREEHKELRLKFTLIIPPPSSATDATAVTSPSPPPPITLSFSHTGTVRVVRALTLPLVVHVIEQIVLPLLVDVLVLGI